MERIRPAVEPANRVASVEDQRPAILVIDDDDLTIDFVRTALDGRPVEVLGATDAASGLAAVRRLRPGLILLDLVLPDADGMDLLEKIREDDPESLVLIMTGHYSTESAVKAIQAGADDYLNKPVSPQILRERVDRWLREQAEKQRAAQLEQKFLDSSTFEGIVGRAIPMLDLLIKVRRIAPHFSTALVTGETGTGKELVSRVLHAWSGRGGPFVVCNCASVVETLFESELFGHKEGRLPERFQTGRGWWTWRRVARSFWTNWEKSRWKSKPSSSGCSRAGRPGGLAKANLERWMSGWSPPPTATFAG